MVGSWGFWPTQDPPGRACLGNSAPRAPPARGVPLEVLLRPPRPLVRRSLVWAQTPGNSTRLTRPLEVRSGGARIPDIQSSDPRPAVPREDVEPGPIEAVLEAASDNVHSDALGQESALTAPRGWVPAGDGIYSCGNTRSNLIFVDGSELPPPRTTHSGGVHSGATRPAGSTSRPSGRPPRGPGARATSRTSGRRAPGQERSHPHPPPRGPRAGHLEDLDAVPRDRCRGGAGGPTPLGQFSAGGGAHGGVPLFTRFNSSLFP